MVMMSLTEDLLSLGHTTARCRGRAGDFAVLGILGIFSPWPHPRTVVRREVWVSQLVADWWTGGWGPEPEVQPPADDPNIREHLLGCQGHPPRNCRKACDPWGPGNGGRSLPRRHG